MNISRRRRRRGVKEDGEKKSKHQTITAIAASGMRRAHRERDNAKCCALLMLAWRICYGRARRSLIVALSTGLRCGCSGVHLLPVRPHCSRHIRLCARAHGATSAS